MAVNLRSSQPIPEGMRNITLCSLAGRLRWEGNEIKEIEQRLWQINTDRCTPPLRRNEVRAIAKSIGRKKVGNGKSSARSDEDHDAARAEIDEIGLAVEAFDWNGRTGTTDRAVLIAILKIGKRAGSMSPTASHRQIAEDAGLDKSTVARAVHRLRTMGWVSTFWKIPPLLSVTEFVTGTQWFLKLPKAMRQNAYNMANTRPAAAVDCSGSGRNERVVGTAASVTLYAVSRILDVLECESDTFRNSSGLGRASGRLWPHISGVPASGAELGRRAGISARSAQRILGKLWLHGLAERTPTGWVRGAETPESVGPTLASHGATLRQMETHQWERERYFATRTRWAQRHLNRLEREKAKKIAPVGTLVLRSMPDLYVSLTESMPNAPPEAEGWEVAA